VHWRGLKPSELLHARSKAYRILEPLSGRFGLVLAEFEEGVEIRLHAANKGTALQGLLTQLDPDVPVAYVGDDITDEDAFRVLNDRGFNRPGECQTPIHGCPGNPQAAAGTCRVLNDLD
jgi:trehalose-phosphatase